MRSYRWQKKTKLIFIGTGILLLFSFTLTGFYQSNFFSSTHQPKIDSNFPLSASSTRNVQIFLMGLNQTHTLRGNNFTAFGYTQQALLNGTWVNTSLPVFPVLNGIPYDGTNGNYNWTIYSSNSPGVIGQYNFSIEVVPTFPNLQNMTVQMNITDLPSENIYVSTFSSNGTLTEDITARSQMQVSLDATKIYLPGDSIQCNFNLTDELGNAIYSPNLNPLPQNDLVFYLNNNISQVYATTPSYYNPISSTGFFSMILQPNIISFGVLYNGSYMYSLSYLEYTSSQANTIIPLAQSMNGTILLENGDNASESYIYSSNGNIVIQGQFNFNNNASFPVSDRTLGLFLNGTLITTIITNAAGSFTYTTSMTALGITDTNITLAWSVVPVVTGFTLSPISAFTVRNSIQVETKPSPVSTTATATGIISNPGITVMDWFYILIPIGIIAGLVIGLIYFQRKRMDLTKQRDENLRKVDELEKMNIVTMLYNAHKRREAAVYTFKIYSDLIYQKYKIKIEVGQTLHSYAVMAVTKYGQDPLHVYPYLQTVEHILYGAAEVDNELFNNVIVQFGRVYHDLTGSQMQYILPTTNVVVNIQEST